MFNLKEKLSNFFKEILPACRRAGPYFSIFVIVLIFFWKFFLKGLVPLPADFVVGVYYPWLDYKWGYVTGVPVKNPMTTDVVSFTYPMQTYAIDLLKSGKLPLWNPLILMGEPLMANFQSSPFSPTNFLYFLFDKVTAWSFQVIAQHLLAALFTYLLLRRWNVSKLGSILGGIVYAFSGYNLIWSQWDGHALTSSFIPLILFFTDRWLSSQKWIDGMMISVTTLLFFLSGYPQAAIYLSVAIFIMWCVWIRGIRRKIFSTAFLSIFFVLGLGLAGFQILPGWELLKLSQRAIEPHPFEWAFLPFKKIITFLAPDFFGNHATKNYWGPQDYTSNTGFVGVVALTLSLLSIQLVKKRKEIVFLVILAAASLILAFPTPVSIFLWKSGIFGLNAASAHRSLILWNLSIALLSGYGYDVISKQVKLKWALLVPFFILIGFGIYAFRIHQVVGLRNLVLPTAAFFGTALIVLIIPRFKLILIPILVLELFYFGWKFTPFSPRSIVFPTTPVLDFLLNQPKPYRVTGSRVIPINMKMPYGIETVEGYDAIYPVETSEFLAALNGGRSGTNPLGRYATVDNDTSRLLDLVNVKYYLVHNLDERGNPDPKGKIPSRFAIPRFREVFRDKSVTVLESKSVLPRSFFVNKWEVTADNQKVLDKLLDPKFDFSKTIILSETPPKDTVGFIFTSDTYYPGWKAFVDGAEAKIYRADFAFRAVPISTSKSVVTYKYEPDSFYNGLKVSLFSLVVLIGLVGYTLIIKKINAET